MKRAFLGVITCLWLLCLSATLYAETRAFRDFSLIVPPEWQVQESGNRVELISPGQSCVVSILVGDSGGMDSKLIASEMSQILKGGEPEPVAGSEAWAFTAEVGGVASYTRVQSHEGRYLFFSIVGERERFDAEVDAIWQSLNGKRKAVRELIRR